MSSASNRVVVLVDDEKAYTEVLGLALRDLLPAPVAAFSRPFQALEALAGLDVAAIISDFDMPQLSGLEFLDRALRCKPCTPCLLITGHRHALPDEDRAQWPEVKEILDKPFPAQALADALRRHVPALAGRC